MRALGYIRVSTAEQANHGHSMGQQVDRIRAWCLARDMELVDVVLDEGVSAGKAVAKRKGGADLLQRMAMQQAEVVVVIAIDRLFRDAQDGLNTLLGQGGRGGLAVQSVTEPIDTTTAMGRFILTIWLARAQLEREQTCERNLSISTGLRKAARPYGHTPYGCVVVDGRLFRDPITWPHRELIVRLRAQDLSGPEIANVMRVDGIPSPEGNATWSPRSVLRVVDSHDGLNHIPALPTPHEPAVSEAAKS